METRGWENIYKQQGEVQSEVLEVVKDWHFSEAYMDEIEYVLKPGGTLNVIKGFLIKAVK